VIGSRRMLTHTARALFGAQRFNRVDGCGSPRGDIAGQRRSPAQGCARQSIGRRIQRVYMEQQRLQKAGGCPVMDE